MNTLNYSLYFFSLNLNFQFFFNCVSSFLMDLYKNALVIEEDLHKCYVNFANQDHT